MSEEQLNEIFKSWQMEITNCLIPMLLAVGSNGPNPVLKMLGT